MTVTVSRLHELYRTLNVLHLCREAEIGQDMEEPQQYGIWDVTGLGLVIAFRGTASSEDVFIDVNITPVLMDSAGKSNFNPRN